MNLASYLLRAARVHPGRTAVFVGAGPFQSYAVLARRAAALGAGLRHRLGLGAGDRVALVMSNCGHYAECMFACWHAGLVCVPVNAKLHAREIAFILGHSGARAVLVTADLASVVAQAVSLVSGRRPEVIEIRSPAFEGLHADEERAMAPVDGSQTAWLFYTSGTTGRPKGAMLTHRNLAAMALGYLAEVDSVSPADCILHAAPMSHGSGLYVLPYTLAMAAHVIPESGGFDPGEIYALLRQHCGVGMFAAPTMVNRLVRAPEAREAALDGLRTIVYGGGPMYAQDCKSALDALGPRLAQIYGQGESPMTITVLPKHCHADRGDPLFEQRLASVGYAQAVVEVKVAGEEGEPLPPGAIGEVMVRGDTVMAGYWGDPVATEAAIGTGWLRTGDMGELDGHGFLTLKDRSKDVIISGGSNIYPREVEEVLLTHDAVAEASVIGRRHSDWGEEVVAFVVRAPGRWVTAEELDRLCTENIARFKRPKAYMFLDALPKNSYGKVLKTELRTLAQRDTDAT